MGGNSAGKISSKDTDPTISSSVSIEEIHDAGISRTAIRVVCIALAMFVVWASFAPVTEITTGMGEIVPVGEAQSIQHLEGGMVSEILVRDGARVERGQPIMRLDDLSSKAELAKALSRAEGIKLEIERRSTSNTSQTDSVLEGSLQLRGTQSQLSGIAGSQQAASRADDAFQDAQIEVARAEVATREADLSSLVLREEKILEELQIMERQLLEYDRAFKNGAVSRNERDKIAREKIQLEGSMLSLRGQRAAGEAALSQSQARVLELQAGFAQSAETAIAELEIEAANVRELVAQLQDRLTRTVIVAPETGRVLALAAKNPGQVISPGEQIGQIIPEGRAALAEIEITADKIGTISEGMDANVKVLTFDSTRFGSIPAAVKSISASSLKRDANSLPYYVVRLELDSEAMDEFNRNRPIQPGMSVSADINLGKKSVMSFLLKPLRSLSDRALSQQ